METLTFQPKEGANKIFQPPNFCSSLVCLLFQMVLVRNTSQGSGERRGVGFQRQETIKRMWCGMNYLAKGKKQGDRAFDRTGGGSRFFAWCNFIQ